MKSIIKLIVFFSAVQLSAVQNHGPLRAPVKVASASHFPKSWDEFQRSGIDIEQPMLFKGVASQWPAMSKWNLERMRREFGGRRIGVLMLNTDKKIVGVQNMYFDEHLDDVIQNPSHSGYYIEGLDGNSALFVEDSRYNATGHKQLALAKTIYNGMKFPTPNNRCELFVGAETKSELHAHEGVFFAQMIGAKRVYLVAPNAKDNLYVPDAEMEGKKDFQSPIDLADTNLKKHPLLSKVTILEVDISPGDVLSIPDHWFHAFHAIKTPSVSMSCDYSGSGNNR